MRLTRLQMNGYRSVRNIVLPVEAITVLIGANGVGKTNLCKGLSLLRSAALGTLALDIAKEGGLDVVLWGGERKQRDRTLCLEADMLDDADQAYVSGAIAVPTADRCNCI